MTEVVQPTDLKIGIDGVAKPVTRVISEVETLEADRVKLITQISNIDPDNTAERERLERRVRHVESRMTHFQAHLDIQFPHYVPSPNT